MILDYITWNVDPEIFSIGKLSIRYYGLMFALAFLSAYMVFTKYLHNKRLNAEMLDQLLIYVAVAVIVGARLGHCLFYEPDYYLSNPIEILKIWKGGLASHGAAVTVPIAIWLYIRKHQLSFLWLFDRLLIVVPLAGVFIRTGNLFNSEIYGRATDVPWAFLFVRDIRRDPNTGAILENLPSHPTQIYESLSYLAIFIFLFLFFRKNHEKIRDGLVSGWFFILLFTARFLIEFIKNDQVAFENGMTLNMGQWLSVPLILIGVALIYCTKQNPKYFSKKPIPKQVQPKNKK
jgi:prolipoprotein diacylglyceryl transferase